MGLTIVRLKLNAALPLLGLNLSIPVSFVNGINETGKRGGHPLLSRCAIIFLHHPYSFFPGYNFQPLCTRCSVSSSPVLAASTVSTERASSGASRPSGQCSATVMS